MRLLARLHSSYCCSIICQAQFGTSLSTVDRYVLFYLTLDRLEALLVCYVINRYTAVAIPKVTLRNTAELFLARCIPKLHAHMLVVHLDCLLLEVNAHC